MTERERLIELIMNTPKIPVMMNGRAQGRTYQTARNIADHLLANGVIVLPCKVGQTVYVPWRYGGGRGVAVVRVEEIKFYDSQMHYMFLIDMESDNECFNQLFGGWKIEQSIGKTVFLTREEAEKALEERSDKT